MWCTAIITAALGFTLQARAQATGLIISKNNVRIVISENECSQVRLAVEALCRDFNTVLDFTPEVTTSSAGEGLEIVVVNDATEEGGNVIAADKKLNGFEAHRVYADGDNNRIVANGTEMRGTIYAVYTLSEKILGVPPLWYWCSWEPEKKESIEVAPDFDIKYDSPAVRYRAWFPNDEDLFNPWRTKDGNNNELWLETMLRLKLNTVECTATVTTSRTLSSEAMLYKKYGLVLTSHHMIALNNSFANWDAYWRDVRKTSVPPLSVNNIDNLKEFWQYSIDAVMNSGVENLWQISFRGKTDQPFWEVFADAPSGDKERGEIITKMVKTQYDMICNSTGEDNPFVRMTFYDEISSLLAKGYIQPPKASNMLWTFVAGRRDHYPYDDLVAWENTDNVQLGYYMNLQFYSTGAHLAPAEGPWKMEDNYRYVMGKGPLTFSVVNAGNLREFLMEMSANASMMWNPESYTTDSFLKSFCAQYFGEENAGDIAGLYKDYYYSYWTQKTPDFPGGFDRQYIFQDLRHSQVIKMIYNTWNTYKDNPLTEIGYESVPGRTFRIEGPNQVEALLQGLPKEAEAFGEVAEACDAMILRVPEEKQPFFYDHLSAYAHYMAHLSKATYHFVHAYKFAEDRYLDLSTALEEMKAAQAALEESAHDVFAGWYDTDDKFEMNNRIEMIRVLIPDYEDLTLTEKLIKNYDFELKHDGKPNPAGNIERGIPYGWESQGELRKGANGLDSYGINQDARNFHGNNVCWINSVPMPDFFSLHQTIPAEKLEPGTYLVKCKLWVEVNKKTSCRLFANDNVQYYGTQADYTNLLTEGEQNTYAGYAGGNSSDIVLRDMEVEVYVGKGEDLTIGIKTGNKRNNGQVSTDDNAGWFKVDFFRIHLLEKAATLSISETEQNSPEGAIYSLQGIRVNDTPSPGIYIRNGRKFIVK